MLFILLCLKKLLSLIKLMSHAMGTTSGKQPPQSMAKNKETEKFINCPYCSEDFHINHQRFRLWIILILANILF